MSGRQGPGKACGRTSWRGEGGETHAGIRCISIAQVLDLYGIERAMHDEPGVLIIDVGHEKDNRVFSFLSRLAWQPTWTIHPRGEWRRRIAAPQMIVTAHSLPAGWSAPDHVWRVIELIPEAA